jgi:hypothetical protein
VRGGRAIVVMHLRRASNFSKAMSQRRAPDFDVSRPAAARAAGCSGGELKSRRLISRLRARARVNLRPRG